MHIRNIAVTLLLALFPLVAPAQTDTFFSEVVEVRITNVDVVVTGRDGKPVTGLTRDDFEIYENGEKKEISNFLEIRGTPPGTAAASQAQVTAPESGEDVRRRDITIFIDDAVLHPLRRNQILPHLKQFVEQAVRPGDTVSIVRWGASLKLELEPTSDRAAIEEAVGRLMGQAALGSTAAYERDEFYRSIAQLVRAFQERQPPEMPPWSMAISEARTYAMRRIHQLRQRVEALKSVITWRRGVEGRKVLVVLTEDLAPNPAEDVFIYLDSIRNVFVGANTMAVAEGREFEYPFIIPEITQAANSAGVTLYPIHAAGKDAGMIERDASTNLQLTPAGSIPTAAMMPALRALAADTGGIALEGSDNWRLAFDRIVSDLSTYYSLGYRSSGEREDRLKKIDVRLKNKRLTVRARNGVYERSVASEMQDAVAANLFRAASKNELSIKAAAGAPAAAADGESVTIPLTVTIPMDRITLMPDGTDLVAKFALYAAFLRKDGAVSKVAQQPGSVRFPAESLKRRKELTVKLDVTADSRTNAISVGVMDEISRSTGFAAVKLE